MKPIETFIVFSTGDRMAQIDADEVFVLSPTLELVFNRETVTVAKFNWNHIIGYARVDASFLKKNAIKGVL